MTPANLFDLTGKVALVTGAGRGLGFEVARGLGQSGATVLCNGRDLETLSAAVDRLEGMGCKAESAAFDIREHASVDQAFERLIDRHGRLDILVNNVGARDRRPLFELGPDDLRRLLDIDLIAPFHLSREAARAMASQKSGRIINISSIAGQIARAGDAAYTAAKGGLEALTRALAAELGPLGITCNAIAPGYFATEANAAMVNDKAIGDWLAKRTSLARWGRPDEIAGAAVFLASDASAFITGQTLAVDGGYLAHF